MKNFIIIISLFALTVATPCLTLTESVIGRPMTSFAKYKVYCEITYMPYQRVAIVNIGSTVDAIRDKDGKPIEFINILDAINYMAKYGWEITEIYGIPKGNDKSTYYFLCKEVSNDTEIGQGLNLKPFDKGSLEQIKWD